MYLNSFTIYRLFLFIFLFINIFCSSKSIKDSSNTSLSTLENCEQRILDYYDSSSIKNIGYVLIDGNDNSKFGILGETKEGDRFKIGSITKIFTRIAILQLQEKGKLRLDDPIEKYLPEFKGIKFTGSKDAKVTIRDLLTHQSGLSSDLFNEFYLDPKINDEDILLKFNNLPSRLTETSRVDKNVVHSYSNLGFSLLGILIEIVSLKSIEDYFQGEIFDKAGMKNSTLLENTNKGRTIPGYEGIFFITESKKQIIRDISAGALSTTPEDMRNFLQTLFVSKDKDGLLLKKSSYAEFIKKQAQPIRNFEMEFGLPLFRTKRYLENKEYIYVGHSGSLPPFFANLIWDPNENIAVFLVANTLSIKTGQIAPLSEDLLDFMVEKKKNIQFDNMDINEKFSFLANKYTTFDKQTSLNEYAGLYSSPSGLIEINSNKSDAAEVNFVGLNFDTSQREYHYDLNFNLFFGLIPITIPGLEELALSTHKFENEPLIAVSSNKIALGYLGIGEKIHPLAEDKAWISKKGSYSPPNKSEWSMIQKIKLDYNSKGFYDFHLEMKLSGMKIKQEFQAQPISNTTMKILGKGRNLGENFQIDSEGVLHYSGYRMIKE